MNSSVCAVTLSVSVMMTRVFSRMSGGASVCLEASARARGMMLSGLRVSCARAAAAKVHFLEMANWSSLGADEADLQF